MWSAIGAQRLAIAQALRRDRRPRTLHRHTPPRRSRDCGRDPSGSESCNTARFAETRATFQDEIHARYVRVSWGVIGSCHATLWRPRRERDLRLSATSTSRPAYLNQGLRYPAYAGARTNARFRPSGLGANMADYAASFCERCGTRYTFGSASSAGAPLRDAKVLAKGLKYFVTSNSA